MNKNTFQTVTLKKGEMHIYDFGTIRLHAYQTNDPIDDEVLFLRKRESRGARIPLLFDNNRELETYLKDWKVEGMLVAYHGAGATFLPDVPKYATQNAVEYAQKGGGKALIDNFATSSALPLTTAFIPSPTW